jgi:hypothetical protein
MGHFDYPAKFEVVFPRPIFAALYCPTKALVSAFILPFFLLILNTVLFIL